VSASAGDSGLNSKKRSSFKIADVVATRSLLQKNESKQIRDYELLSYILTIKESSELIHM
jgi:hypothetical protein